MYCNLEWFLSYVSGVPVPESYTFGVVVLSKRSHVLGL